MSHGDDQRRIIEARKRQQLHLALAETSQSTVSARWEDVHLIPSSIPDLSLDEVTTETTFLGHRLSAPIVIAGMTGGHAEAFEINRRIGEVAEAFDVAVGVGSQRAALVEEGLAATFSVVRRTAPNALVVANIGLSQLVPQGTTPPLDAEHLRRVVDMVEAQVLAVHVNVLEELVQPEGDRNMAGHFAALAQTVERSPVPVIVKETGAGMDRATARRLSEIGIAAIDVGGLGGTSFARIEASRATEAGDVRRAQLGATFASWGIPTGASVMEVADSGLPIVATGGVRSGLDAAKAIALGAELVGIGRPLLVAAVKGVSPLTEALEMLLAELRTAMILTASPTLDALRRTPRVLSGLLAVWRSSLEDR